MTPATFVTTRLLFVLMAVAALASAVVFVTATRTDAATFNPFGSACLDDETSVDPDPFSDGSANECDGNNAPGAASSITTTFGVGSSDSNFGAVVSFTPPEWGVALDADITDGTQVARLTSKAVLGLLNSSCSTSLPVGFDMLEATTDQSDTVLFNEPNKSADFDKEQFEVVNGLPRGVTQYPDYLLRILWAADEDTPLQPISRLYGQTLVSGVPVSLNFAIFEPGTTIRGDTLDPALGYPSVTVLNNGGDPDIAPAPSAITDFCSPLLTSTTTYGSPDGQDFRTNPDADGTYNFIVYTASQRDADDDGFENGLDTCPYTPNPDWDPRAEAAPGQPFPGDTDRDGLPDNCDPLPNDPNNPGVGAVNDHDGDNYYNRQDNCPLVQNNLGIDYFVQGGDTNQGDEDMDGIGDECDEHPNDADADGLQTIVCVVSEVVIGSGGTAPPSDYFPCGTNTSQPTPGPSMTATPVGQTPGPGSLGPPPSSGVGSLAPSTKHLPLWAVALAVLAVVGMVSGGFVLARYRRD
jgi:hypothetical protein